MKNKNIFILMLLFAFSCNVEAISSSLIKKYPYSVLTNDHGILNESDLESHGDQVRPPRFLPKKGFGYIYWQCFPRENITINLSDIGYSSEDIGWDENFGDLKIIASNKLGDVHEYLMRRMWPVSGFEEKFNAWIKLMKGEKYVCLAGSFIQNEVSVFNGKKHSITSWDFERLKTKKGCDSYFQGDCPGDRIRPNNE